MNTVEKELKRILKESIKELIAEHRDEFIKLLRSEINNKPASFISNTKFPVPLSIIRPTELANILSISKVTLWRMEKEGNFPTKIQIGTRSVGWLRKDIEKWLSSN